MNKSEVFISSEMIRFVIVITSNCEAAVTMYSGNRFAWIRKQGAYSTFVFQFVCI